MTLSDIELYESLLARDEVDRRFRLQGGLLLLVAGLLAFSKFLFGHRKTTTAEPSHHSLIEEPVVMITLAGWGIGLVLHFMEAHRRIDQQIGK